MRAAGSSGSGAGAAPAADTAPGGAGGAGGAGDGKALVGEYVYFTCIHWISLEFTCIHWNTYSVAAVIHVLIHVSDRPVLVFTN